MIQGPILPDRLTQVYHKGPDHPTPFAKGTEFNDTTTGGFVNATTSQLFYQPPPGWIFEKKDSDDENTSFSQSLPVMNNKRSISNDDDLEFIPREEFGGRKDGFVFRLGSKGLGYYKDKLILK